MSAIRAANFTVNNFLQFAADELLANCGNVVDKHFASQVVAFVLHHAGKVAFDVLFMGFEVFVLPFEVNLLNTGDVFVDSWQA